MNDLAQKEKLMLENVRLVKNIIRNFREGKSAGSHSDELVLHRILIDLDMMVELNNQLMKAIQSLQAELQSQKDSASEQGSS